MKLCTLPLVADPTFPPREYDALRPRSCIRRPWPNRSEQWTHVAEVLSAKAVPMQVGWYFAAQFSNAAAGMGRAMW